MPTPSPQATLGVVLIWPPPVTTKLASPQFSCSKYYAYMGNYYAYRSKPWIQNSTWTWLKFTWAAVPSEAAHRLLPSAVRVTSTLPMSRLIIGSSFASLSMAQSVAMGGQAHGRLVCLHVHDPFNMYGSVEGSKWSWNFSYISPTQDILSPT